MMSTQQGGHIDETMHQISGGLDNEVMGNNDVILNGDGYQLGTVTNENLQTGSVKNALDDESIVFKNTYVPPKGKITPMGKFREIICKFKKIEFKQLHRSDCPHLSEMIRNIRSMNNYNPLTMELLLSIPELTVEDIRNDISWLSTSIAVTTNAERFPINKKIGLMLAQITGKHLLSWSKPIVSKNITKDFENLLYDHKSYSEELTQYFMAGSKINTNSENNNNNNNNNDYNIITTGEIMLTENINPLFNLANGTLCSLHSILYKDKTKKVILENLLKTTPLNEVINLDIPDYILIELSNDDAKKHPKDMTAVKDKNIIPLKVNGRGRNLHSIKLKEIKGQPKVRLFNI